MKRLLLLLLLWPSLAYAENVVGICEPNKACTINFALYELDGTDLESSAACATGDIKISEDEAAEANSTNCFVDEGTGYSLVLPAADLTGDRTAVYVIDQTDPKVWLDKALIIYNSAKFKIAGHGS